MHTIIYNIFLLILIVGCSSASKHMKGDYMHELVDPNTVNKAKNFPAIKIKVAKNKSLSDEKYKLLNLYFENETKDWVRIKSARVVDVNGVKEYQIIIGDDLRTLKKSMALELKADKMQLKILEKTPKEKLDPETMLEIERLKSLPDVTILDEYQLEDHLYSKISIPAGLAASRWLVVFLKEQEKMKNFDLEITFIDNTKKVYRSQDIP